MSTTAICDGFGTDYPGGYSAVGRHVASKALLGKSVGSIPGGVFGLFPKQKSRFLGVRGLGQAEFVVPILIRNRDF